MGACNPSLICAGDTPNEYVHHELLAKKFSKEDLGGNSIEIGENGFEGPLNRKAMLQENFSNIYDK